MSDHKPIHPRRQTATRLRFLLPLLLLLAAVSVSSLAAQEPVTPPIIQEDTTPPPAQEETATPPAQEEGEETYPTDEEVYSKLEAVVLSETRSGDMTNTVIEIPVGADTFVTSGQPDRNWSNDPNLRLGFNQSLGLGAERVYLFFDVARFIPSNATVNSARLRVYQNAFAPNGDSPMPAEGRFLNSSWNASQVTWNNHQPDWGSAFGQTQIPAQIGWRETDFTGVVRAWVSGSRQNFGMIIIGDERQQQRERIYYSLNANNGLHPRMIVDFSATTDTTPPTSTVRPLPQFSPSQFRVTWEGSDNQGGTGIAWFDVQYRVQNGAWTAWLNATTATSADFRGAANGLRYDFRVRAVDRAGNVQQWSNTPQASTTADTLPPTAGVNALPQYTYTSAFIVSWSGTDNLSGIARYDVEFRVNNGAWNPLLTGTTATSVQFTGGTNGALYGFRARAVDNVGNVQSFPNSPQATTVVSIDPPRAEIVPFNPVVTNQQTFTVRWTGSASPGSNIVSYEVRFRRNNGSWTLWQSGVASTSASFTATQGDGVYEFQVRARDNLNRQGEFARNFGNTIVVDRVAPFVRPQDRLPIIVAPPQP